MSISAHTIRLYWQQIKRHRISFFIALIAIPLSALALSSVLAFFVSQAIGQLVEGNLDELQRNLLLAAGAGLIGFLLNLVGFRVKVWHESRIISSLRSDAFEQLIQKDLQFFVNQKVGSLTSKYIEFIRSYFVIGNLLIVGTIGFVLSLLVGLVIIAVQSWLIALVLILLLIGLVIEVRWSLRHREPYRKERRDLRSEMNGKVADNLSNSLVVKTFARESEEIKAIKKLGSRFSHVYWKDISFVGLEGSIRILIMITIQLIAISLGAWLVVDGQVDIATVIFSITYLQLVSSQLFEIGTIINGYEEALLEASPMTKILLHTNVVNDAPDAKPLELSDPSVELDNVSYHYSDSDEEVLDNVALTIPAGQKVGLVGHSGAGKTTVTHLLLRFSDVTGGSIRVGGQDIRTITQKSLRQHVAYVPQEPVLFHRTLRENIEYGKTGATDKEIRDAAEKANALEFIDKLPNGLDTLVGERGVKLSGGQRQRIAIARAILKDAPILILDEATSALDSESEKLIQEALEKLMKGRTSIVIAHRLSTIAKLDRIVVLEKGKITEDGTHAELLANKGIYARLWAHQSGGFIEE